MTNNKHWTLNTKDPWILTHSGRRLSIQYPSVVEIDLRDVAHALSQINRYTGHTDRPWSVAQHSLLVGAIMEQWDLLPILLLQGLLHDAPEYVLGDVASPLKQLLGSAYHTLEARWDRAIHYALMPERTPYLKDPRVKVADMRALDIERWAVFDRPSSAWPIPEGFKPTDGEAKFVRVLMDCPPNLVREMFLDTYRQLRNAIQ